MNVTLKKMAKIVEQEELIESVSVEGLFLGLQISNKTLNLEERPSQLVALSAFIITSNQ